MKNESVDTFVCYAYKPEPYKPAENDVEEDLRRHVMPPLDWEPTYTETPLRDSPAFPAKAITIPSYSDDELLVVSS